MGGKGDQLGIVQEKKINLTTKLYMHKPESILVEETHKILWDFEIQTDHLISARKIRPGDN